MVDDDTDTADTAGRDVVWHQKKAIGKGDDQGTQDQG